MSERLKRAYDEAEERMAALMRDIHERGELRHLHGKPLQIEEDDPAWLAARMLKEEGFSHPLLERRQEVDAQVRAVDARVDRLRERRLRLEEARDSMPPERAEAFNAGRSLDLEDYREDLSRLNRLIRDYNLTVPLALHIRPIQIEQQVRRVEERVPPLDPATFGARVRSGGRLAWLRRRRPTG